MSSIHLKKLHNPSQCKIIELQSLNFCCRHEKYYFQVKHQSSDSKLYLFKCLGLLIFRFFPSLWILINLQRDTSWEPRKKEKRCISTWKEPLVNDRIPVSSKTKWQHGRTQSSLSRLICQPMINWDVWKRLSRLIQSQRWWHWRLWHFWVSTPSPSKTKISIILTQASHWCCSGL